MINNLIFFFLLVLKTSYNYNQQRYTSLIKLINEVLILRIKQNFKYLLKGLQILRKKKLSYFSLENVSYTI